MLGADAARRACATSMVGTGNANFRFGSEPVSAPLTLFNGSTREGATSKLLFQAAPPAPFAPIVSAMKITPIPRGPYGLKAVLPIPPIDEGKGELTHFRLDIHRLFGYNGVKESYATARCANRSLAARMGLGFSGGSELTGTVRLPCTPGPSNAGDWAVPRR